MADIFENILENVDKDVNVKSRNSQTDPRPPIKMKTIEKSGTKNDVQGSSKENESKIAEKSSDITNSKKSSKNEKSLDKLADIMANGFTELKNILSEFPSNHCDGHYEYEEFAGDEDSYEVESEQLETDLFDSFMENLDASEAVGPNLRPSLANLADKLLTMKTNDTVTKEKREHYLRPRNVEFLQTPKINKPVWESLSTSTRIKESSFQTIQNDFLSSAVPVLKAMEKIYDARDNLNMLDAKDLLDGLKDSLVFLGSANAGMLKARRENVRRDLPKNMHGLCRDDVQCSSTLLFGENLNSTIKEVSELNKISSSLRPRGSFSGRSRGFNTGRGRGRLMRRGGRVSRGFQNRFHPYVTKKPLNKPGPSRK